MTDERSLVDQSNIQRLRDELKTVLGEARKDFAERYQGKDGIDEHLTWAIMRWLEKSKQPALVRREYRITVPGIPRSWGVSTKAQNRKGSALKDWQEAIAWEWRRVHRSLQLSGPVQLAMHFLSDRSLKDTTNMFKGGEDALKSVAFDDDDRVYEIHAKKEPARKDDCLTEIAVSHHIGPAFAEHL